MPNYEQSYLSRAILIILCLGQYLPQSKAKEPTISLNNITAPLDNNQAKQADLMPEEFLLFLADFDNEGGVIMDPLDMISVDIGHDQMPKVTPPNQTIHVNGKPPPSGDILLNLTQTKENK